MVTGPWLPMLLLLLTYCYILLIIAVSCLHVFPWLHRSLNWTCPACGSCNNSALPDKGEGQGAGPEDQEKVNKEMEEIVSQMTIKVWLIIKISY